MDTSLAPSLLSEKQEEVWKEAPNYPGYAASTLGRARRQMDLKIIPTQNQQNNDVYAQRVGIIKDGKSTTVLLCKLVADAFIEKPFPTYNYVHFRDGDIRNCRPDNLKWAPAHYKYRQPRGAGSSKTLMESVASTPGEPAASPSAPVVLIALCRTEAEQNALTACCQIHGIQIASVCELGLSASRK